jgi:hypothetical protein
MKHLLSLLLLCVVAFTKVNAQARGNGVPWDFMYHTKSDVQEIIKGEKGKIIEITFLRVKINKGVGRVVELTLKKRDAITGEMLEYPILININTDLHYILKEGDALVMDGYNDGVVYLSGYKYDVQ